MVTICTVLPAAERPRIDAAGDGCFNTLHAESLREALYVARRRGVDAVVISVHRCHGESLPSVARFVREFPAIPAVALVSRHDREATETLLRLGATGCAARWIAHIPMGGASCAIWSATLPRPSPHVSSHMCCPRSASRPKKRDCSSRRWRGLRRP